MDIRDTINQSKLNTALHESKVIGEIKPSQYKSGRFPKLDRFTKMQNYLLESLYTISDIGKPSSYRIYLYLLRQITGFENRSRIEYRSKKIKNEINMKNCFYEAIKRLEDKNMIKFVYIKDVKHIELNPDPHSWKTVSSDKIDEIMNKEINTILGKTDQDFMSISSSSWSSSSSSSNSDLNDDDLLVELDNL